MARRIYAPAVRDPVFSRAVNRFERAVRAHEMRGCLLPQAWPDIDEEFESARASLMRYGVKKVNMKDPKHDK